MNITVTILKNGITQTTGFSSEILAQRAVNYALANGATSARIGNHSAAQ